MNEEDQKFLALLIDRTGEATCAATVVALGKAIKRWMSACEKWDFARWEPEGSALRYTAAAEQDELRYTAATEQDEAAQALQALVAP